MMNLPRDGQVVSISNGQSPGDENARRNPGDSGALSLRQRIVLTVRTAQAEREVEKQRAADRLSLERQEAELKSKRALLKLLSDDSLNSIIGQHAKLGELSTGTVKVSKHGTELFRGSGVGAGHTVGEIINTKFEASIVHAGKMLKAPEILSRLQELQAQGVALTTNYDASSQAVFITFDYEKALL